jgi:hypothetical protein
LVPTFGLQFFLGSIKSRYLGWPGQNRDPISTLSWGYHSGKKWTFCFDWPSTFVYKSAAEALHYLPALLIMA